MNERSGSRPSTKVDSGLLALQLVSRYWRRVALSTPQLWAYIHFNAQDEAPLAKLRSFIERSKTVPLEVFYRCIEPRMRSSPVTEHIVEACDLLRKEFHRLRSLTYVGSVHHLFPITNPLPILHALHVTPADPEVALGLSTATFPVIPYFVSTAPRLEVFSYNSIAMEPRVINALGKIDLNLLREVSLASGLDEARTSNSLLLCTAIRKLKTSTLNITPLNINGHFPYLHKLDMTGKSHHLPRIVAKAPQLVHLAIRDYSTDTARLITDGWPAFPHLRTLTCSVHLWGDMIPILQTSPRIIALRASGERGLCSFLRSLGASTAAGPEGETADKGARASSSSGQSSETVALCPDLQRLDIQHNPVHGSDVEEGEDSLLNVTPLLRQLLTRRPKLTVKLWEGRRSSKTAPRLDMDGLEELALDFQQPDRLEIHRSSARKGVPPASVVFDTPLSEIFPCRELIAELEKAE